ncbi:hypothetical protein HPP92_028960 [Vanilla planifolia]|uniref:Uncharacterized protein n=1 Tax=Vanilla planifolia TaxID=51239 RepID=A0A835P8Z6_VANPL|nr:hypothetical protein HPP92_028960 [Vanilla planifolia]KAG0446196.1 hypothetical protein HPP92_028949 [Vanilla planifolia]
MAVSSLAFMLYLFPFSPPETFRTALSHEVNGDESFAKLQAEQHECFAFVDLQIGSKSAMAWLRSMSIDVTLVDLFSVYSEQSWRRYPSVLSFTVKLLGRSLQTALEGFNSLGFAGILKGGSNIEHTFND